MRAALTTYFHLTGQAKVAGAGTGGARKADPSEERERAEAGRAGSWGEAGARFKGYLACKGYARPTCECYVGWGRRFWRWCAREGKPVEEVDAAALRGYLEFLAGTQVGAKTQNQALNALVCFFRHGIGEEPGEIGEYLRAKARRRLPVVLSRGEASALMGDLKSRGPAMWLMAGVMLGAGLRQREMLELRVQDIDLERGVITVRRGKGNKDRVTMLPERVRDGLKAQLERRRAEYEADLAAGAGYVPLPEALDRKKPGAARSWGWQYVFGGQNVIEERETGRRIRWHVHENTVGRLLGDAARRCGIPRAVTCHALRHTFATLALENGTDIRTLQELLGHNDVATTMIYTHVLNRPGVVARSPLDGLAS
jgi:integron integrase